MTDGQQPFFRAGGALPWDIPSYVARQADEELYAALLRGEFCYLLTSRQMGKTSLIVRTRQRLREAQVSVGFLDLTRIGATELTIEQWLYGMLSILGSQLSQQQALGEFWRSSSLGPVHRWFTALNDILLPRLDGKLVIFIDEIDMVNSLSFSTDDFFAGIRECYNRRAMNPDAERLTFCLSGVASPGDLIRNPKTTPFNIGRRIELLDFNRREAEPLSAGFANQGSAIVDRVLYWTGGHPYLTQRLCEETAQAAQGHLEKLSPALVDRVCRQRFLSEGARQKDGNLTDAAKRILGDEQQPTEEKELASLLHTYRRVCKGQEVLDEPNPLIARLKLSGIVRAADGRLRVTNRIYARCFNKRWVRTNMPGAERRRQKKAFRRGILRGAMIAAAILGPVIVGGLWTWDRYYRLKVVHYTTYARRWGVPVGIGRLTDEEIRHRSASYRFHERGGVVEAVDAVDGSGRPTSEIVIEPYIADARNQTLLANSRLPVRWEYVLEAERSTIRSPLTETAYDASGRRVSTFLFIPWEDPQQVMGYYVSAAGRPEFRGASTRQYVHIDRNESGHDVKVVFRDARGHLAPTQEGGTACGYDYHVDPRGLVTEYHEYSAQEVHEPHPFNWFDGCSGLRRTFDAQGRIVESMYIDGAGRQNLRHDGSGRTLSSFDAWGREVESIHVDLNGKPTLTRDGYAGWLTKYDDHGQRSELQYVDAERQPTCTADGYSLIKSAYSPEGKLVLESYFDTAGRPTFHKSGYSQVKHFYSADGDPVADAYFGLNGEPVVSASGQHRVEWTYSTNGMLVETRDFGINGQPVLNTSGYCSVRREFDDQRRQIREDYFGLTGLPTLDTTGVSGWTAQHDERGNVTIREFHDEAGKAKRNVSGYAKIAYVYDASGTVVEQRNLDEQGELTLDVENGRAISRVIHSLSGNATKTVDLDTKEQINSGPYLPISEKAGDEKWMKVTEVFRNAKGEVVLRDLSQIDIYNRTTRNVRMDQYDDLRTGATSALLQYDPWGRVTSRAFLEEVGKTPETTDGDVIGSVERMTYDERGREIEQVLEDAKGARRLGDQGYSRRVQAFDHRGDCVSVAYFGIDDAPVDVFAHFDAQGAPIAGPDASAAEQEPVRQLDSPLPRVPGVARVTRTYSASGQLEREVFESTAAITSAVGSVDSSLPPAADASHPFRVRTLTFDAAGFVTGEEFFAADGKARVAGPEGYAQLVQSNAAWGAVENVRYLDAGNVAVIPGHLAYARAEYRFNERGQRIREAYFDADDKPTDVETVHGRIAEALWDFDDQGRLSNFTQSRIDESSLVRTTQVYDADGNVVEIRHEDEQGRLVDRLPGGYARKATEYVQFQSKWQPVREEFYDTQGIRTLNREFALPDVSETSFSYYEQLWKYDNQGRLIERSFRDDHGQPVQVDTGQGLFSVWQRSYADDNSSETRLLGRALPEELRWGQIATEISPDGVFETLRVFFEDSKGKPAPPPDGGAAVIERTFDDQRPGLLTSEAFLDVSGRLTLGPDGYAGLTQSWDDQGRSLQRSYSDVDGRLKMSDDGYAATERVYEGAFLVEEHFFGRRNEPVLVEPGFASRKLGVTGGRCTSMTYFGVDRQPVNIDAGYAEVRWVFDEEGRLTDEAFLDSAGQPVVNKQIGFARMTQAFTAGGQCRERSFFDAAGRLAVVDTSKLDANLPVAVSEMAKQGPRWQAEFDEAGQLTAESYLDDAGEPRIAALGFARARYAYDATGRLVEAVFLDAQGGPIDLPFVKVVRNRVDVGQLRSKFPDTYEQAAWQDQPLALEPLRSLYPLDLRHRLAMCDPALQAQLESRPASRLQMQYGENATELSSFRSSTADQPSARLQSTPGRIVYRVAPVTAETDANPAPATESWELSWDARHSDFGSQLTIIDADGAPVLSERGYSRARTRSFTDAELSRMASTEREGRYVIEYFGLDLLTPASYRGAFQQVRASPGEMGPVVTFVGTGDRRLSTGIQIRELPPDHPAAAAGLKAGEFILRINTKSIDTRQDWYFGVWDLASEAGSSADLFVMRGKETRTAKIPLGSETSARFNQLNVAVAFPEISGSGDWLQGYEDAITSNDLLEWVQRQGSRLPIERLQHRELTTAADGTVRVDDAIDESGSSDYFRLVAVASGDIAIEQNAAAGSGIDCLLAGYDGEGYLQGRDDDGGLEGGNARLVLSVIAGSTYYIEAGRYGDRVGAYTLSVSPTTEDRAPAPAEQEFAPAPPLGADLAPAPPAFGGRSFAPAPLAVPDGSR